jgi:amino-acid N-acetyltransferase
MTRPLGMHGVVEPFGEKDFYLEEFRGRSVLIAVAPGVVTERVDLRPLASAIADLVRNDTRVLVWWPSAGASSERRLLGALGRSRAIVRRRRGSARRPAPLVRAEHVAPDDVLGALWSHLRVGRLCVFAVRGAEFPMQAISLATAQRIPKVVVVDVGGGLRMGSERLSFVDENVLETLLRQGEAEWTGLGDRRALLVAVRDALDLSVESVNLCTPEGISDELFSYEGSGTLFTAGDYCRIEPLALDDFAQAERLLERGQREGFLKIRTVEETAQVLASGFGATICPRHLAGVAGLLTVPYAAEHVGEIVGLYTITRFKGEGIGERLVRRLIEEAQARGLVYVFACAIDDRARQFFERLGFTRVTADDVPAAKWKGYDVRRRSRVAVLRRRTSAAAEVRAS